MQIIGLMEEGVKSVKREYDISNFAEKILQRALRTINKNINLLSEVVNMNQGLKKSEDLKKRSH
ncbi:19466_t:CDS:2 [Entrophospora sp. SA101]|nr:19466_t:CDS:2 [Entrophospora sp. SA101]